MEGVRRGGIGREIRQGSEEGREGLMNEGKEGGRIERNEIQRQRTEGWR